MTDSFVAPALSNRSMLRRAIGRVMSLIAGLAERNDLKPYIRGAAISVNVIWFLCALYLLFMPKSYVSKGRSSFPALALACPYRWKRSVKPRPSPRRRFHRRP